MKLHPFQVELSEQIRAAYADKARSVIMQLGTGGGKTHTCADIIERAVAKGKRVIFAAHLDALIDDTSRRLTGAGIDHGIVQAERPTKPDAPVQVASLATLHRRGTRPPADLVIVDECRRAMARTVREVLLAYPKARLLGADATPERGDGTPLGDIFERMVCGPSIAWLTSHGFLVPAHVLSPPCDMDGKLAMDPADAYARYGRQRQAIIFCATVEHAREIQAKIEGSALITGETPREIRERVRRSLLVGELRVIVNVDVYRDGADLPSIGCVIIGRTMGVTSAYLQACGRGLRSYPGKDHCLILDLSGAAIAHGLVEDDRVWSLTGAAVHRTGDALKMSLARCGSCFAVFRAGPAKCPRCGVRLAKGSRIKPRRTRVEQRELSRLDTTPLHVRDQRAIQAIMFTLFKRGKSEKQAFAMAKHVFRQKFKREPEAKP